MAEFVRYNMEEWSALYQDGSLVKVGDSYLTDEYLANFLNVEEIDSDDCFLGKEHTYDNVAQNIDEILAYGQEVEDAKKVAQSLKEQAESLLLQASFVENSQKISQILESEKYVDSDSNIWRLTEQDNKNVWRSAIFREESDFKTVDEMSLFIAKELMN